MGWCGVRCRVGGLTCFGLSAAALVGLGCDTHYSQAVDELHAARKADRQLAVQEGGHAEDALLLGW